jgi:mono/diheme cytochrome c family protein
MPDDNRRLSALARACLLGAAFSTISLAAQAAGAIDKQDFDQVQRGHYLTAVGDCAACHT